MKATGIVRRIDDLGRVVIPKEIRRTMRIREGDPLEIYTGSSGEVVFRKYSPIGELSGVSAQYADAAAQATKLGFVITDRDHCISAAGISKREIVDKEISPELERLMEDRKPYIYQSGDSKVPVVADLSHNILAAFPIISSGDLCGSVLLIPSAAQTDAQESDLCLARVAASFLGKQLEN